ncbi:MULTISPECIES: hypothetical protein [unclassified Streptomyces]|uniref:hypothetical protein n=1 Tax=unclassified Streptomyces TaxID=2593676 RepID=UPI0013A70010|nr:MULTISPECIES: hypothetical protein [unclassified Streptomyces]
MSSPHPHHPLCIDTPDYPAAGTATVHLPSADLLDRAAVGWEQFTASMSEGESDA